MVDRKTIAIFGAGIGLGASLARHYGKQGYQVALVARHEGALHELAGKLKDEGLEVAAFPADLTNIEGLPGLVDAIETQFGAIDVAIYSPVPSEVGFVPASQLDAAAVQDLVPIYALAPIELAHRLTTIMKQRGAGAIVVGGLAAVRPIAGLSGAPALMAATRNYIHALHGELAQSGVFAGAVYIGAMIEGSTGMKVATSGGRTIDPRLPTISLDTIAEAIWRLTKERAQVEAILPAFSQS
ncbi:MAG: SDR family NAD(P)-dependent oxidoreductase [Mesorhizobium sp.]|nr:SDR family NAD(P)-dependent oxidoreductase [Mesorhizobium sp.]TIP02992.1 MAG: SDR family NAD(P)-dependent oxidoreductase [Mesorhizobium sp.]TIP40405.1 MAG: SDR family NAD(P)-dependent oxidoreductase [Mesorhizobium sp.]TJV74030.1 MAG: SDR family NAD(P)-dependent oxidoreductase [Mesorhizobium sp.]